MNSQPGIHPTTPLLPDEVDRVHRVYDQARKLTGVSRHDLRAERLAAMAIRFYQLGMKDEGVLLMNVVNAHRKLHNPESDPQ